MEEKHNESINNNSSVSPVCGNHVRPRKIPLGVTSMIVCIGLVVTGVLDIKTAFAGFIDSNVILFVAMFIVGGALFEAVWLIKSVALSQNLLNQNEC